MDGIDLTHEAAVGKIGEEQVQYLMSRGYSEEEAESLIVRDFMDVSIFGVTDTLRREIKKMVDITKKKGYVTSRFCFLLVGARPRSPSRRRGMPVVVLF